MNNLTIDKNLKKNQKRNASCVVGGKKTKKEIKKKTNSEKNRGVIVKLGLCMSRVTKININEEYWTRLKLRTISVNTFLTLGCVRSNYMNM